jgi:cytochrome c6
MPSQRLLALVLLALVVFTLIIDCPALAGETTNGAKIFNDNCASCHLGGGNIIIANKTLKKPALLKYNMKSLDAIVYQVQHGKNAMPAFKGRLSDSEIVDVAAYVLEKAEQGW